MAACAHTSSTEREDCAADISTPKSGAQPLHSPFLVFQHFSRHTQAEQRGHCMNCGRSSLAASTKASSCARSQLAERTDSLALAAVLNTPPNRLLAVPSALLILPMAYGRKLVRKPLLHRSQKNSNWKPCSVLLSL